MPTGVMRNRRRRPGQACDSCHTKKTSKKVRMQAADQLLMHSYCRVLLEIAGMCGLSATQDRMYLRTRQSDCTR